MKVKNKINPQIIEAAVGMLKPYVPELSPTRLIAALEEYDLCKDEKLKNNERPKKPYTISEVCELLGISRPTLDNYEEKGLIRKIHLGRLVRIPVDDIDSLLSNQKNQ